MRHLVTQAGLGDRIAIDSAGTGDWHVGEPRDRAQPGGRRGARDSALGRARSSSRRTTSTTSTTCWRWTAPTATSCCGWRATGAIAPRCALLRSFDPSAPPDAEVPDPYYGGPRGFDEVFDICERACRGLLDHLRAKPARRRR